MNNENSEEDSFNFDDGKKTMNCLHYFFEGLGPLLSALCNKLSLHESQTELKEDAIVTLKKLGTLLMVRTGVKSVAKLHASSTLYL